MKPARRIFGEVFKLTAICAVILVIIAAGALVAVLQKPTIVLNEKNARWAARLLEPSGLKIDWDRLNITFDSRGWLEKRFDFDFSGLCVSKTQEGASATFFSGCFPKAKFGAVVSFKGFKFRLPEVGPVQIEGRQAQLNLGPEAKGTDPASPEKEVSESNGDLIPGFLKDAKLLRVDVTLESWELKQGPDKAGRKAGWTGQVALRGASDPKDQERVHLGLQAEARSYGVDPASKLQPALRVGLDLNAGFEGIRAKIDANARDMLQSIPEGQVKGCVVDLERRKVSAGHLALNCPMSVRLPLPPKKYERFKLPVFAGAKITADLNSSSYPPAVTSKLDGKVRVELDPILHPVFDGRGDIRAEISGVPARFPKNWKIDTDFDLKLSMPEFQKAVTELEKTPWTVPAPFAVMKGSIELAAKGKLNLEKGEVPLTFRTRLSSRSQVFNLDGQGALHLSKVMPSPVGKVDFDLVLSDVLLALPHLKLENPPRFVPDGRIRPLAKGPREKQLAGAAPAIAYAVKIHTPGDKPLRLLSNLADSAVPIALDLHLGSDSPLGGSVGVVPFEIEAFRRKAKIDHFDIQLLAPPEESEIDGAINVAYADYTVTINMINTIGKPVVRLTSDPPLPEDQLWATLLFGAPLDALDPDQAQSVGNTQAAVTDGAIGLASLYALASTPVERVGYDSTTGMFTAKVKLGTGTSLNVGSTGTGLGELGVRRRLSKHWAVNTDLLNPTDTSERTASAFLEWSYKY